MISVSSSRICRLDCVKMRLLLLSALSMGIFAVRAQSSTPLIAALQAHIAQDLELIRAGQQLPAVQRGALWARLAADYHKAGEFVKAEDAYNRSLHLLKNEPSARTQYASTLDDLASLLSESTYGRLDDAENVRKQALAVRKKLGDASDIGLSEVHLADIALARHQPQESRASGPERSSRPGVFFQALPQAGMLSGFDTLARMLAACGETVEKD